MSIATMLRGHDVFGALSVEDVARISNFSAVKNFEKGETVFHFGRPGTHVFLLLEGRVHLRLPSDSPELSIAVGRVDKGEIFGLSPLLGSREYTTSGHCQETSSVLAIEARELRHLLQDDRTAGYHIMNMVARVYFNRYLRVLENMQRVVSDLPLMT